MTLASGSDALVRVELITASFRLAGVATVTPSGRISDVLNAPAEDIVLADVTICTLLGAVLDESASLRVAKNDVLLAVPKESQTYLERRRMNRVGIRDPDLSRVPALVIIPPFLARGLLSVRSPKDLEAGIKTLNRFFPLLEATLHLEGRLVQEAAVLLVNRDGVLAVGGRAGAAEKAKQDTRLVQPDKDDTMALLAKLREETEGLSDSGPNSAT